MDKDTNRVKLNGPLGVTWPKWVTFHEGPNVSRTRNKRDKMRRKVAERAQLDKDLREALDEALDEREKLSEKRKADEQHKSDEQHNSEAKHTSGEQHKVVERRKPDEQHK